jgi:hypothetical protein
LYFVSFLSISFRIPITSALNKPILSVLSSLNIIVRVSFDELIHHKDRKIFGWLLLVKIIYQSPLPGEKKAFRSLMGAEDIINKSPV